MNRILICTLALAVSLIGSNAVAQTLQVPNTFQAGTPARAAEVNQNFDAVAVAVNGNTTDIAALIERQDTLEARIADLEARLAEAEDNTVLKLNGFLDLDSTKPEGPIAIFAGVNVQVVNGTGRTDRINGVGNLVVGYDEERVGGILLCSNGLYDNEVDCVNNGEVWSNSHKSGSHNIVVGWENSYSRYGGLVAGESNAITAHFATVTGGLKNTASGSHSSVSGGTDNLVTARRASVSGGLRNKAAGIYASVSGGSDNTAIAERSSVSGGLRNTASGIFASVSGGSDNLASAERSSVSGGLRNTASALFSSVSGGRDNTASGEDSSISGGNVNKASGRWSSVSGGRSREAQGDYDWVAGGLVQDN